MIVCRPNWPIYRGVCRPFSCCRASDRCRHTYYTTACLLRHGSDFIRRGHYRAVFVCVLIIEHPLINIYVCDPLVYISVGQYSTVRLAYTGHTDTHKFLLSNRTLGWRKQGCPTHCQVTLQVYCCWCTKTLKTGSSHKFGHRQQPTTTNQNTSSISW